MWQIRVQKGYVGGLNQPQWWDRGDMMGILPAKLGIEVNKVCVCVRVSTKRNETSTIKTLILTWFYQEIRRPAAVSDWKVLLLFLCLACTCSFVLLLLVFASSESRSPPPSSKYYYYCCCYYYYYSSYYYYDYYYYDDDNDYYDYYDYYGYYDYYDYYDHHHHFYSYTYAYFYGYSDAYSDSSTPTLLLLYSFLPSSTSTTLVVPVANDIAYSISVAYRYSSQGAHGTDRPVHGSVFVSSSLRLRPSVEVNLPWGNLSTLSPSMQRSAVKPEAHTKYLAHPCVHSQGSCAHLAVYKHTLILQNAAWIWTNPPATKCFWVFWWWVKSQCGSLQNGYANGLQWKIMILY